MEEIKSFPCNICDYDIKIENEDYCSQGGKLTKIGELEQCPASITPKEES